MTASPTARAGFIIMSITREILDQGALFTQAAHDYHANVHRWLETSEEVFWAMLEVLPPTFSSMGVFAMGETYTHERSGRPVYLFFAHVSREGRYFAQYGTITDYKAGKFGRVPE